jgi:hypothetical protein
METDGYDISQTVEEEMRGQHSRLGTPHSLLSDFNHTVRLWYSGATLVIILYLSRVPNVSKIFTEARFCHSPIHTASLRLMVGSIFPEQRCHLQ